MRKVLIIGLAALVVLVAAGYVVVQRTLGGDMVRAEIEQRLASRLGQPVHVGSAGASILPEISVDLRDVSIGQPAAVQLSRVRLVTGLRGLFSRRIENAAIVVDKGRIAWPLPFAIGGNTGSEGGGSPVTVTSVREIRLRDVTLATALPPISIDLDASLSGDRIDVTRLSARSDRNHIDASGALTSLANLQGRFRTSGELTVAGHTARNISATIALTPAALSLSPMSFAMFDGKFDGALTVDLHDAVPRLQLKGSVARADVAELLKNTGSTGGVTGRLVGALSVASAGSDGPSLMRGAHGTFHATIVDGTLPYIDIVRPVILAFGKPSGATPSGSGSSFSSLAGNFTLAGGIVKTDNLTLNARDFTAHGSVVLNIDTADVNSHLDLVLSQELTAQAGTDLRRYAEQNGRVVVPATISGTLTHPTVFVDTAAAMKRAAENELKRKTNSLLNSLFKKKKTPMMNDEP